MVLANIGCGTTFHPDWINLDLYSSSPNVRAYDVTRGMPFPDNSLDAVYLSHMLEHLEKTTARAVLSESFRVLCSGGVVRVVVPDLEGIVRAYLAALERAIDGNADDEANYNWMMLELYDQAVRTVGGGDMGRYLTDSNLRNRDFVRSRMGFWVDEVWQTERPKSLLARIRSKNPQWWLSKAQLTLAKAMLWPLLGPRSAAALEEGLFRQSGQIHKWMYDRYSLGRLLTQVGFSGIQVCTATRSRIPDFAQFELDAVNGQPRKPDSLYMEGIKL
ncbi:MAG: methyltransferase domain-containing protein [Caldilineaceae bacterium]|nr:methyltransferase domain-containing protein [Caldilineaceae bacterium]